MADSFARSRGEITAAGRTENRNMGRYDVAASAAESAEPARTPPRSSLIKTTLEASMTRKIIALAAASLFAASTGLALAQSSTSTKTPGHQMQNKGSVKGEPGASGYSPGDRMHDKGSVKGEPGASGYAPGHTK
jgi:hypothetical protein